MSTARYIEPLYLTLDEFMARPERKDGMREELLEGELIVSPGPKARHADVVRRLREELDIMRYDYVVVNDFSCVLQPRSMPIPDLALVSRERWEKAVREDTWLEGSPELVIEVMVTSPSNRKLFEKAGVYLAHGAEQVWIVFPKRRTVSVLELDGIREVRGSETLEFHDIHVRVCEIL